MLREADDMTESSQSLEQIASMKLHNDARRRSARSESLVGSYMTKRHPNRFNSASYNHSINLETSTTSFDRSNASFVESRSYLLNTIDADGTSWWAGVIIMANCTIGMGLLNFPRAIHNAGGVFNALAFETVILVLIIMSLFMISRCTKYYGNVSYQDMVTTNIGRHAGSICKLLIFLNNFGACIVVLVVLGDQWERFMYMIYDKDFCYRWYLGRKVFVPIFTALGILPLCFLKSFGVFKYTSFLGVLAAAYVAFGIGITRVITGVEHIPAAHFSIVSPLTTKVVKIIPLICFAYECHIEVPPMIACLKKSSTSYYMRMVVGYVLVSFVIYSVGGISGYVTFGDKVHGDFIIGYAKDDKLVLVAMILLSLKIWTTYPVIFYCLRTVVDDVWKKMHLPDVLTTYWTRRSIQTIIIVTTTVFISVLVPSISDAIELIGGISAVFVFIFPGISYMTMHMDIHGSCRNIGFLIGAMFTVLGVFLLGATSSLAVQEYINGSEAEPSICSSS